MADKPRVRFRVRALGLVFLIVPLLFLFSGGGLDSATPAIMTLGLGLPALTLLSLLFVIPCAAMVRRQMNVNDRPGGSFPSYLKPNEPESLQTDPPRPAFLPGAVLWVGWRLTSGPFTETPMIRLPALGAGLDEAILPRRGLWSGRRLLRVSDPFGFFAVDFFLESVEDVICLPEVSWTPGNSPMGRPASEMSAAPRPKEDAEDRHDHRDYRPGDDTRFIDWKQKARTGALLLRIGEDGVPERGRIYLELAGTGSRRKRDYRRMDAAVTAMRILARRLSASGAEVLTRLPGDSAWREAFDSEWDRRLAEASPRHRAPDTWPGRGEVLWIFASDDTDEVLNRLRSARTAGCRVHLCLPQNPPAGDAPLVSDWSAMFLRGRAAAALELRLQRTALARLEKAVSAEGFDVWYL